MAKISANGATEVARVKAKSEASGNEYTFVLTSDGRLLEKDPWSSGYTVKHRVKKNTTPLTLEFLRHWVELRGLTVTS